MNALESLKKHFAAMEPTEIELPGLDQSVFVQPLNAEEAFAFTNALRKENPRQMAMGVAHLVARKVRDKEGKPVFVDPKAAEILAKECNPEVIEAVMEVWSADRADAEDVEKKSERTEEAP